MEGTSTPTARASASGLRMTRACAATRASGCATCTRSPRSRGPPPHRSVPMAEMHESPHRWTRGLLDKASARAQQRAPTVCTGTTARASDGIPQAPMRVRITAAQNMRCVYDVRRDAKGRTRTKIAFCFGLATAGGVGTCCGPPTSPQPQPAWGPPPSAAVAARPLVARVMARLCAVRATLQCGRDIFYEGVVGIADDGTLRSACCPPSRAFVWSPPTSPAYHDWCV